MATTSEYWVSGTIGEGSFGTVVHARHKTTHLDVAIKCIDKNSFIKHPQQAVLVVQEQQFLKRLKEGGNSSNIGSGSSSSTSLPCPFVVNLYASFHDAVCVYLVTECCMGGTLQDLLTCQPQGNNNSSRVGNEITSTTRLASWYGSQLVQALWYLHACAGIVHCDVKPANILLTATGCIKLADFGSAFDLWKPKSQQSVQPQQQGAASSSTQARPFMRGTAAYSAPEMIHQQGQVDEASLITPAVDLWSLGCLLFALLHCGSAAGSSCNSGIPPSSPFDCNLQEAATIQAIVAYCIHTSQSQHQALDARLAMLFGTQPIRVEQNGDNQDTALRHVLGWRELIASLLHPVATERLGARDTAAAVAVNNASPTMPYPSIRASSAWWNNPHATWDNSSNGNDHGHSTTPTVADADTSMLPPVPAWWTYATSINTMYKDGSNGWSAFLV